ncbi:MAG: Stk1 family PASTA domain-containing Ser/Thr kinase [Acidaminococcus provencensis]|jgi:serine/threonine-protein kinase|uniref:Stk1 family PASTA domain-containing Ser/Thr kinase n=1 Tax=Acidaminococcus TaxID=904 RepID=UPI000CF9A357|nr:MULTISPECIES: Stk1 family PASTA domain-containing Ser/Thr kinase [Acidaminococcus]MCH4096411.1 Stk1 family PASTA domain-containing Ser/Thr kinase [Acidaminococcus provencensis]RHK02910.1 Stk1 family PASTA domain-containing Ser/Thr kinase [Acidaminococcus sp. AM05-11]
MNGRITLNGRYEIIDKIGGGGMAEVFHGYDTVLHRDVGIKILRDQFIQDKQFVARFRQEACNAAGLSHPNIVNIYDCGNEHEIYYIVMEYVVGRSLKEVIEENGALDYKTAVRYAIGICSALKQAHDHSIVHCDVKSQNILIDTKGVAKITDFGIARAFGQPSNGPDKNVIGSVYYLSPEQAAGQPVTPQSDLYSLGVVFFEMLTGKLPYDGATPLEVARHHLESSTPSARRYDPDIPYYLDNIVTKALAKNPQLRYASADDFLADLKDAQTRLLGKEEPLDPAWYDTSSRKPVSDETMVISKTQMLDGILKPQPAEPKKDDVPTPEEEAAARAKKKKFLAFFLAAIVVLSGVIYAILSYTSGDIPVPDVKGKPQAEAELLLTKANLGFEVTKEYSPTVAEGVVIKQSPGAGSKVKAGRKIKLVVSQGAEPGVVPDLKKKSLSEATQLLEKAKLKVGSLTVKYDSSVPQGTVISQSVSAGSKVTPGTSVDLVMNISGNQTAVPSLEGLSLDDARSKLSDMGLTVGKLEETNSDKAKGTVLSVSPGAGQVVERGSTVNLVVSAGKKEEKKETKDSSSSSGSTTSTRTITYTVPGSGSAKTVKIIASDATSSRTVFSGSVAPGTQITRQVTLGPDASVQIYVNGALAEDKSL